MPDERKPRYRGRWVNGKLEFDRKLRVQGHVDDSGNMFFDTDLGKPRYVRRGDNEPTMRSPRRPGPGGPIQADLPGEFKDIAFSEADVLRDLGNQQRGGPVEVTYFPTSTSDPADPRTAAAGYDPATQTLRVEWGDGGRAYNYYGVPPNIWRNFRRAPSPGRYINRVLNYYMYGPA